MSNQVFCLEGELEIWSNEGGYSSPSVCIGNRDLAFEIEQWFSEYVGRAAPGEIGDSVPGKWRFTLEQIS